MAWSLVTSPHAHHSAWCHIGRWTASAPGPTNLETPDREGEGTLAQHRKQRTPLLSLGSSANSPTPGGAVAKKNFPPTLAAASQSLAGMATSNTRDISCFGPQKKMKKHAERCRVCSLVRADSKYLFCLGVRGGFVCADPWEALTCPPPPLL